MKTSHQNQALPKAQGSTAEGGSMHAQHCCLWLKLQPPFSCTENSHSQVPLPKEEGEEGRGGCVCSLESASTPARACQTGCPGDQCLWLGPWVPLLAPRGSWGGGGIGWRGGVMLSMALGMEVPRNTASRDGPSSGICTASSFMQPTALNLVSSSHWILSIDAF